MVVIGTDLAITSAVRFVVGMTIDPSDPRRREVSVAVTIFLGPGVGVQIDIMAVEEVGRGHHIAATDDIEAVAPRDKIQMTKLAYRSHEGASGTFPTFKSC